MVKRNEKGHNSRLKRIREEQIIQPVQFQKEATSSCKKFEETISAAFGVPGIGKSRFAAALGLALQEKYSLPYSGVYFLQCEPINHPWRIRKSQLRNWPTFRKFVDDAEKDVAFVSTVKMWVIDTIDGIVPKGISTICDDFGISDLKDATVRVGADGWFAKAWQELRDELLYQILRLDALGPGVLILSHERERPFIAGCMRTERASMDISNSINNSIGDACSIIMRIRHKNTEEKGQGQHLRCLSMLSSETEDVKDNLNVVLPHYPDGTIPFRTEEQAVERILGCFGTKTVKKVKKKKKVKR